MTSPAREWTTVDTVRSIAVVVVLGCLYAYDRHVFGMALTFPSFVAGAIGIARRRITVGGRGGRNPRTYVGWQAVVASLPFCILGGFLTLWQATELWPTLLADLGVSP